jgi:hypothetical protein
MKSAVWPPVWLYEATRGVAGSLAGFPSLSAALSSAAAFQKRSTSTVTPDSSSSTSFACMAQSQIPLLGADRSSGVMFGS